MGSIKVIQDTNPQDITKDVAKEETKLNKLLAGLPKEVQIANKDFVHQLAFQNVTLRNLSNDISVNGVKETYLNGASQYGYKDRTEVSVYNKMFKIYQSSLKQLNDLLAKYNQQKVADDSFESF